MSTWIEHANSLQQDLEPFVIVTVVATRGSAPRHIGSKMLVDREGNIYGTIGGGSLELWAQKKSIELLKFNGALECHQRILKEEHGMCCGGIVDLMFEPILPKQRLVIFGAGHIGAEVAHLVSKLSHFQCHLVDERPDFTDESEFPENIEIFNKDPILYLSPPPSPDHYYLILTHNHALDQNILFSLLPLKPKWIGLIGSKAKRLRFKKAWLQNNASEDLFEQLRCPVGLAIKGETPFEIAISITADLIDFHHAHSPRNTHPRRTSSNSKA